MVFGIKPNVGAPHFLIFFLPYNQPVTRYNVNNFIGIKSNFGGWTAPRIYDFANFWIYGGRYLPKLKFRKKNEIVWLLPPIIAGKLKIPVHFPP